MTKMVYTVVQRPKKFDSGRTDIGWKEDGGFEAVPCAGYLITSRTKKGELRTYSAYAFQDAPYDSHLGDDFTTRAQAAFAIWRSYYLVDKTERFMAKKIEGIERDQRREARLKLKELRKTPEGQAEYKKLLNAQARARRAAMTHEQKAVATAKRKEKRLRLKAADALEIVINRGG